MSFFPEGYEQPKSSSKYLKLVDGENLIRILSAPIMGWLDWKEDSAGKKTPVRTPYSTPKPEPIDSTKPIKHFWAFVIWDYKDSTIKIWEVTQSTIQEVLYNLDRDVDWGEPTNYDISIKRSGEKLETKYITQAKPPKPVSSSILDAYKEANPNLEELFSNGDPFNS